MSISLASYKPTANAQDFSYPVKWNDQANAIESALNALLAGPYNALINGDMQVWQRGTSAVSCPAGSRTYRADRWYVNPTGAAVTAERSATVPTGSRAKYSLQINGAASVTTCLVGQRIESLFMPPLKRSVTFEAAIYNASGAAITPTLLLGTPAAQDDFTTVTNRLSQALQSCANGAWTTVYHTVDISGYTNIDHGLQAEIQLPDGALLSGDVVRVTELVLIPGPSVMDFMPRPHALEQALCERYLPAYNAPSGSNCPLASGQATSTSAGLVYLPFRTAPRTPPTGVTVSNAAHFAVTGASGALSATSSIAINNAASPLGIGLTLGGTWNAAGDGTVLYSINASAQLLFTGCEL